MWKRMKLEELITLQNGFAFKSSEYTGAGYFVMRITNVQQGYITKNNPKYTQIDNTSKLAEFILSTGDILLSLTGNVGRVGIVNEEHLPAVLNQRVARVVNKDTRLLDTKYLFHFLTSTIFRQQVEDFARGAAQDNVSTKDISQITIQIPPLAEQQRIVAKLDAAFAEIEVTLKHMESKELQLEILKTSLLNTYLNKFSGPTERLKLSDLCDLQNGYAFRSKDYVEYSSTLNIRMSNIRPNGNFDASHNIRYLPDSFAETHKTFKLFAGDLIVAMTDMAGDPKILGKPTIVSGLEGRTFLLNQRVGKLYGFSNKVHVPYLSYFLSSLKDFYKSKGAGGLQINISKKDILSAEIILPPLSMQRLISGKLDQIFYEIDDLSRKLNKVKEQYKALKKSILAQELRN